MKELIELNEFAELVARLTTSAEFEDGAGGDAVETLDRLILEARELTGITPDDQDDEE